MLEPLGLTYAAPAYLIDLFKNLYLTDEQHQFIEETESAKNKQNFIDKIINRQFRAEYWVKELARDFCTGSISGISA